MKVGRRVFCRRHLLRIYIRIFATVRVTVLLVSALLLHKKQEGPSDFLFEPAEVPAITKLLHIWRLGS